MIKKFSTVFACLCILVANGCMQFALRLSPSLFPNFAASIFEECDPELAKKAIPAHLKLLEGLLKNDPQNSQILKTLSMGFCGYSMLFTEVDDPERASEFYLRAKEYGIKALGDKGRALKDSETVGRNLKVALKALDKKDLEPLLWATISWSAWINLNLDKPAALAQLSLSQACLERVLEIDANYLHGLPYILMGVSLSGRPKMFGGNIKQARAYFEKALELSDQRFFLAQYYFARYYAVRVQDKKLFYKLIQQTIDENPRELRDVCLINTVMRHRARQLAKMADEFFF